MSTATNASAASPSRPSFWQGLALRLMPAALPTVIFAVTFYLYAVISRSEFQMRHYFVPLAQSLLLGRLDVVGQPSYMNELVPHLGKDYVVFPFMPDLLEMPWVLIWQGETNQLWPCLTFGALNAALVYILCRRLGLPLVRRLLYTEIFAFGTIVWYSAQDAGAWHYAQVTALSFMLLAVLEVFGKGRAWLMGTWLGCALLCRLTDVMAAPFFALFLLAASRREVLPAAEAVASGVRGAIAGFVARYDWRAYARKLVGFGVPLSFFVGLYLTYNHLRFGSPLTTGYSMIPGILEEPWYRDGFFNLNAIPRNLYTMFLKAPEFSDTFPFVKVHIIGGLSILLTTPIFLWAVKARGWDWYLIGSWLAIFGIATPIFLHGDIGGSQFGYRYAMDFYPFLFLLMVRALGDKLTFQRVVAIVIGAVVNAWGIWVTMSGAWA